MVSGCPLFEQNKLPALFHTTARKLPKISLPPHAIQLEVVYVERPIGDARLGRELWDHVDEVGALEIEAREVLEFNGFRVGVVGANPPPALQKMLGMKADYAYEPEAERAKQVVGHRYFLQPGGQTEIQTSQLYPECTLSLHDRTGAVTRTLHDARCGYRV